MLTLQKIVKDNKVRKDCAATCEEGDGTYCCSEDKCNGAGNMVVSILTLLLSIISDQITLLYNVSHLVPTSAQLRYVSPRLHLFRSH